MIRKLYANEKALIEWMIKDTVEGKLIVPKLGDIIVEEMNDGGMGSLRVVVNGTDNRRYAKELDKADLHDIDGVPIFFTVNLDEDGSLFELDVFKGDFSSLKRFPSVPNP